MTSQFDQPPVQKRAPRAVGVPPLGGIVCLSPLIAVLTALSPAPLSAAPLTISEIKRDTPVDFAKDIYPLLKASCLACHNTTKAKAGLNLESPQAILKGGDTGPSAVAGKGAESLILRSAAHQDDPAMPPPGNKVNAPDLTPDELGLLKLWIDQGLKGGAVSENVAEWRSFPGQRAPVSAAALSASGRIAAAARGNQVQLTEVSTGITLGFLTDPELAKLDLYKDKTPADRDAVMAVAFGGDDLLATGGFRTARLWRRAPLTVSRPLIELPAPALSVATTDKFAAAGEASGVIRVWEPAAEKPAIQEWKEHKSPVKALCFSPDGQFLISAAEDKTVRVWEVASKNVVYRADAPAPVTALCFLKNGTELAATFSDGMLRVYPFPKDPPAAVPAPLREHKLGDQVTSLTVPDPAGTRVLWTNAEPALHITDTADGKRQDVPLENPAQFKIAVTERQKQAAQRQFDARKARLAAAAETVKKETENLRASYQKQEKARMEWQQKLEASRAADTAQRSAPEDGGRKDAAKKAAGEATAAERAFTDARTNAELAVRLTGQATQAHATAEGAATAAETSLTETTAALEAFKKALPPVPAPKSLTLLDGGKSALIAFDGGRLQWHSTATGEFLDTAEGAAIGAAPVLLTASPAGFLAARPDKKIALLPPRRPFILERTIGKSEDASLLASRVTALSFSSDARLLATGGGVPSRTGEVKIWNTADGSLSLALTDPHSDTVNALAFSPDDSLIATAGSDRWARVFRTDDGKRTAAFEGHSAAVLSIGWRSDGLALATGGADKTLRYWDLLDNKQTRSVTSFGKEVSAIAWLGTGDTVASASGDEAVRMNEEKLPGAKSFCYTLTSDPGGKFVAAGGEDGVLRIWVTGAKKLLLESPAKP